MTCGEHDAGDRGVVASDRPAQRRSGQVAVGDLGCQPVGGEHFGSGSGEAASLEACVVADEHGAAGVLGGDDAPSRISDAAQALVGEILANDRAPSISAELDVSSHGELRPPSREPRCVNCV